MKKKSNFIQKAIKRPGALTNRAKANHRSVAQQIQVDLNSGTTLQKKQANLAVTLRKMARKRKAK